MRSTTTVMAEYAARQNALYRVLNSGVWTDGANVQNLADDIRDDLNVGGYAIPVANGTVALVAALYGVGVTAASTVVVPAYGFPAAEQAIRILGATPFFVDVDKRSGLIDADLVFDTCTDADPGQFAAIVAIDHEGNIPDYDLLTATGLPVIEDAAAAYGSTRRGRPAGTLATVGTFSFNQSKKIRGGEGGAIWTDNEDIANRLHRYVRFGESTLAPSKIRTFHESGINFKMGELEAAMARVGIRYGPERIENAIDFGVILDAYLRRSTVFDPVDVDRRVRVAWHKYPLLLIRPEDGREILSAAEIPIFEPVVAPVVPLGSSKLRGAARYFENSVVIGSRIETPFDGGAQLAKEYVSRLEQKELEHEHGQDEK